MLNNMEMIDEIVSIEPYETQSCRYDITVENEHNFFANGILVHNCQTMSRTLESYRDIEWEMTEKLDGSSCSIWCRDGEVGVCSRNLDLKLDQEGNAFVDTARAMGYLEALPLLGMNIAVQGELIGGSIQGNPYKITGYGIWIFSIWLIDEHRYAIPSERAELLDKIRELGVDVKEVPFLGMMKLPSRILDVLDIAVGKSILNPTVEREGIVFKSCELIDGQELSFKAISNVFLLKEKE